MRISSGKYRSGKGNLFAACPVHFLTSQTIGNVYICPVTPTCLQSKNFNEHLVHSPCSITDNSAWTTSYKSIFSNSLPNYQARSN